MLKYKIPQVFTLTQSLDRIYKKVSIKYRNKKNEQALSNPSPRVRKAQRLFFFTCINFVT